MPISVTIPVVIKTSPSGDIRTILNELKQYFPLISITGVTMPASELNFPGRIDAEIGVAIPDEVLLQILKLATEKNTSKTEPQR